MTRALRPGATLGVLGGGQLGRMFALAAHSMGYRVWVLDPDTMTVSSREVRIGRMTSNKIEILEGLYGGEEIVSVGAAYLAEGMRVSRMIQTEQAVPRADDPA